MKNFKGLTAAEYRKVVDEYIVNCITSEDVILATQKDKVNHAYNRFIDEIWNWHKAQKNANMQDSFADWLSGLPLDVDFENYRIIELAKEWGALPENSTERQEDKIIANWFRFIACRFLQLHARINK